METQKLMSYNMHIVNPFLKLLYFKSDFLTFFTARINVITSHSTNEHLHYITVLSQDVSAYTENSVIKKCVILRFLHVYV